MAKTGMTTVRAGVYLILMAAMANGCGARAAPKIPAPPPIPTRMGELAIDVVYPPDSGFIAARDSNFIFGSVGNGNAQLTINGVSVPVEPNGSFLAWLEVPASEEDTVADYELVASLGDREKRVVRTVRLPRAAGPLPREPAVIDVESASPQGAWWVRRGEIVRLRARASPGAELRLLLPEGDTIELTEKRSATTGGSSNRIFGWAASTAVAVPTGLYEGEMIARTPLGRGRRRPGLPPVPASLDGVAPYCAATVPVGRVEPDSATGAPVDTVNAEAQAIVPPECAMLELVTMVDTVRTPLLFDLWILREPGPVVELREEPSGAGRDGFVVGRAAPGATSLWLWTDGVRARVTGRRDDAVRLALDERAEAWVDLRELAWLPGATLPSRARVGTVRLTGRPDLLRARVEVSDPVPYRVNLEGGELSLTLYGAYSNTDWLRYGPEDEFLRSARWEQDGVDRYVLRLELGGTPWGYRARYEAGSLVLDVRKPPLIDPERPLSGLTIAVDPGHPPAGSTGPTRLYEGDVNLAIAYRLKRLLQREGAEVVMTRADRNPVRVYDRTALAEMLNADLLVSIHNNALPDAVNPFENHGTSVYYFHPHSLGLARALQRSLLGSLGLRDLGIGRASLALARPTWMPAALTEGAFMMIPAQEAWLRNTDFLETYAVAVLEGVEAFVRRNGRATPTEP